MQIKNILLLLLLIGGGVWLYFHFSKDEPVNQVKTVVEEDTGAEEELQKREAERLAAEEAEQEKREAEREKREAERERREAERLAAEEAEREKREAERLAAENREKADQYAELAKEKEKLSDIRKILRAAKKENAMTSAEVKQLKEKLDNIDDLDDTIKESATYAAEVLYIKICVRNKAKVDKDITSLARDCYSCNGKKYRKCSTCNGSGKCYNCSGDGIITPQHLRKEKHMTRYYDTVPYTRRHQMCIKCGGDRSCKKCKGKGEFLCKDCKGRYPVNMKELHEDYEKKIDIALDGLKERIKEISAKMKAVKPAEEVAEEEE